LYILLAGNVTKSRGSELTVPVKNADPKVVVFPLPPELETQYLEWANSFQFNEQVLHELREKGYAPLFIPVYPGAMVPPESPAGPAANPPVGGIPKQPFVNPFLLFLILILLLLGFKRDQILSAVRRFLLKTPKPDQRENPALK